MTQVCVTCSSESPDLAKFCLECGTLLTGACPACGHAPGPGKFCMECGTPNGSGSPAVRVQARSDAGATGPVSERRTTSVLFGDLVAFTTLSESRDPEDVRELLSEYFGIARTVVARYGGTIEKFIGDAVMAVWGVPISMEDDAERAVRAGLDLVTAVAALGESVGAPGLSMRVGITTGSVAVTLGAINEGMVAGDAVNTAARVQTAAEPGTVWVDPETRGLTAAAIAFSDMGEHVLKGKAEPARLFRADAVVAAVGGLQRVDGLEAPIVGRDRELRDVKELFHATETDGKARIVVVTGVAGVGKSRLGWEFEKYIDGINDNVGWHRGRCLSYGEGIAFWAFAEMMRMRLGLLEGDDREQVAAKLREGVEKYAISPEDVAWLLPRLAALLNSADGAVFDRTDLFAAWSTFLERVGADGAPVVLLFEDAQYADSGLLDLIDRLLESCSAKLFVLVLSRPELLDNRPSVASGRRATVIEVEPLADEVMAALVDALVDDLPDKARTALVGRAEGIPLYAVETVRSLIDRDAVQAREGRYVFVDHDNALVDLDQLAAPTSLQMLIAARLDALTPVERRTVQDASVLGLAFRQESLMALSDVSSYDLDAALSVLAHKGVIEPTTDPRSPERGQYRFGQALVRDVAYSTLARKDRRSKHLSAAVALETESGESSGTFSRIIAQHLIDALSASSPQDADQAEVAARARAQLVSASERAEALGSPAEAFSCVLAALDLEPEGLELVQLQELGARTATVSGNVARAEELAILAYAAYEALGEHEGMVRVLTWHFRALKELGRTKEAAELARAGEEIVERYEISAKTQISLLWRLGMLARTEGDVQRQLHLGVRHLRLAEEIASPGDIVEALNNLAVSLGDLGCGTAFTALMEHAAGLARERHMLVPLSRTIANLLSEVYPRDLARASVLAAEAVALAKKAGDSIYGETAVSNAAFTWWLTGDWDLIVSEGEAWLADREPTSGTGPLSMILNQVRVARGEPTSPVVILEADDPYDLISGILAIAIKRAADGEVAGAAAMAVDAADGLWGSGEGAFEDFEIFWAAALELQLAAGNLEAADHLLGLAAPMTGGRGRPISIAEIPRLRGMVAAARGENPEADLRAAESGHEAYGAVYLLARTRLELGRWLLGEQRTSEAETVLAQARESFVALGAGPAIEAVDSLKTLV